MRVFCAFVCALLFAEASATTVNQDGDLTTEGTNENVKWLKPIKHLAKANILIDISLPRIDNEEVCSILTPNKDYIDASKANIERVYFQESSYFVSCRITIGPMVKDLTGNWSLCGTYTENDEEHKRCQPVNILWSPQTDWHTHFHTLYNYPVHFGSTMTPAVVGIGDVVSCNLHTPTGENLAIEQDSKFPSVKATHSQSTCKFEIGPLHRDLLGDWTIVGLFSNSVQGLYEESYPFHMFLYDEENPYNQAYNVTILPDLKRPVSFGIILNVEVDVNAGQVDSCYIKMPSGRIYKKGEESHFEGASFVEESDGSVSCRVAIGPITEELLGDWNLIGKFSNNDIFTERQQPIYLLREDSENPLEEDRLVIDLPAITRLLEMGQKDRFVISSHEFDERENCLIVAPNGLQYQIMKGFSGIDGVEDIAGYGVECGVIITVVSEDILGDWTLISRATHLSKPIERRFNFTIYRTEYVEASQDMVNLTEGDDLYVSLKEPTPYNETCKLIGPIGHECQVAIRDPERIEFCGFIKKDVQPFNTGDTGTWTITFGLRSEFRAKIAVTVNDGEMTPPTPTSISLTLVRDRPFNQAVGLEIAVYCRLEDPQGFAVFDNFGRCHLSLDKVGLEHHGTWKMFIATPGKIITEEHQLIVTVRESAGKPVVMTKVEQDEPIVTILCSVQTDATVTGCMFRKPQGKILIASSGLAENRYEFYGEGASYKSGVKSYECGILINNPIIEDLGLWRCALDIANETYYGHMLVFFPFVLGNLTDAVSVQQEPILKATRPLVSVVEGERATMSCAVESVIRYCYFRAGNGTIFTVTPGMPSSSIEYVGAGFDAGECGIRFHGLDAADSGRWSCFVGLQGVAGEQSDQFQIIVYERMRVRHFTGHGNIMTVEGIVHEGRALEYCRFIRIDGFGFSSYNMPAQCTMTGILENGECRFTVQDPSMVERHPWVIAARIRGQDVEIVRDTMESVVIAPSTTEVPGTESPPTLVYVNNNGFVIFVYMLSMLLVFLIFGACLGPRKHRQWTAQRATAFRSSFTKKQQNTTNTPPPYRA